MIQSKLKKLAANNGLTVAHGVAYGNLRGYAATLSSVSDGSQLVIVTRFADPEQPTALQGAVNQRNIFREFGVLNFRIGADGIHVDFNGSPEKIQQFLDFFMPLLPQHGASGVNVCPECGCEITDGGKWKLVNGVAYPVHPACGEKLRASMGSKTEPKGSYLTGTLGALLGSALGSVVWALVLCLGYVASIVGLLIGWLAQKFYNLFHGKQGKLKVVILIAVVILGVLLGTFLGYFGLFAKEISESANARFEISDIPGMIFQLLEDNEEFRGGFIKDTAMGLIFAALGVSSMLVQTGRDVSQKKYIDLD